MTNVKRILRSKLTALVKIIVVVSIFFTILNRHFISLGNLAGIMTAVSLAGIFAVGIVPLLISGHVDLASGAEGCIAGVFIALIMAQGIPWPLAIVITLVFGGCMGLFNAFLVNKLGFMAFIATIGMSSVYKGLALTITGGANVSILEKGNEGFYALGKSIGIFPVTFLVMLALMIIYSVILKFTKFGRSIYLCGGNSAAARLTGVNPKKVSTILFINCGAICALGGALFSARMHMGIPNSVYGTEMDSIAAAVLGGVSFMGGSGGLGGAFIGLVLVNLFNSGITAIGLPAYWQIVAQGAILVAALLVDYFGEKSRLRALKAAQ